MIRSPNLIVLAGPNGSGKSTFFDRRLAKWKLVFVNPDIIAKQIAPEDPSGAAFRAARIAEEQRRALLESGQSFITEGIRPDLNLLIEAKDRGYFTRVVFVCLNSPEINVSRVVHRVSEGGHSVPFGAVVARYPRALNSLPEAAKIADQLLLVDNSERLRPHRLIARFEKGKLVSLRTSIPPWASGVFGKEFEQFRIERHQQSS